MATDDPELAPAQTNATPDDPLRRLIAGDEDLVLTLPYIPAPARPRAASVFALALELRRIPPSVREPPLGEIRLQWWRDRIGDIAAGRGAPAGHPTLQAIAATGGVSEDERAFFEASIDGRSRFLYAAPFSDPGDAVASYAAAEQALAAASADSFSAWENVRQRIGLYAAARFGGVADPNGAPALARHVGAQLAALSPPGVRDPSAFLFVALSKGYLKRLDGRPWPVGKRLALFTAMTRGSV